jgi:hypothetical protein
MRDLLRSSFQFVCLVFTALGCWIALFLAFVIVNGIVSGGGEVHQPRLFFLLLLGFLASGIAAYYFCRFQWDIDDAADEVFDDFMAWYRSLGWFPQGLIRSSVSALLTFILAWLLGISGDFKLIVIPIGTIIIYLGISAVF